MPVPALMESIVQMTLVMPRTASHASISASVIAQLSTDPALSCATSRTTSARMRSRLHPLGHDGREADALRDAVAVAILGHEQVGRSQEVTCGP